MNITPEMPKASVTIQGFAFEIPQPFGEGHQLTANEAAAMNQLFAENIRNNFASQVKAEKIKVAGDDASKEDLDSVELTEDALENLQTELNTYVEGYQFGERKVRAGGTGASAEEKMVARVAEEFFRAALKSAKKKVSDIADDVWEAAVEKLSKRQDVIDEAQRRLAAKKEAADNAADLADILG